jgi:hypothetical protein
MSPFIRRSVIVTIAASIVGLWCAVVTFLLPLDLIEHPGGMSRGIREVERRAFEPITSPCFVILGSSRPAFGLTPRAIEAELGLPDRCVVNGAYPELCCDPLAELVKRNIAYLRSAHRVLLVVDDYWGLLIPNEPAPAIERIANALRSPERFEAFLSGYLNSLTLRSHLYWAARNLRENIQIARREYAWTVSDSGRWFYRPLEDRQFVNTPEYTTRSLQAANGFYREREISPPEIATFEAMLAQLKGEGISVAVFDMPHALPYVRHRNEHYGELRAQRDAAFGAVFERLKIPFLRCETAADCGGFEETVFADPVHLNAAGARALSAHMVRMLMAKAPEMLPGHAPGTTRVPGRPGPNSTK